MDYFIISKHLSLKHKKARIIVGQKYYNTRTRRFKTRKHRVYIIPCYESYEQYGAYRDILFFTLPIAKQLVSNNFTKV